MKILKIALIALGALVVVLVVSFAVYLMLHRQGVIAASETTNPQATHNVLIASQGSKFKNALVESLIISLKEDPVSIKVIDVTSLGEIDEGDWDALVLIHTTEKWQLQPDVKSFLDRSKNLSRTVLVTTSGDGNWRTKDYAIDAITSASRNAELPTISAAIINRLDLILSRTEE